MAQRAVLSSGISVVDTVTRLVVEEDQADQSEEDAQPHRRTDSAHDAARDQQPDEKSEHDSERDATADPGCHTTAAVRLAGLLPPVVCSFLACAGVPPFNGGTPLAHIRARRPAVWRDEWRLVVYVASPGGPCAV